MSHSSLFVSGIHTNILCLFKMSYDDCRLLCDMSVKSDLDLLSIDDCRRHFTSRPQTSHRIDVVDTSFTSIGASVLISSASAVSIGSVMLEIM